MFSRTKLIVSLAVPALVASVFVALPSMTAQAAAHKGVQLLSSSIAVGSPNAAGNRDGKVKLGCSYKSTTCKGTMRFLPDQGTSGSSWFSYSIKPGKTAYVAIRYWYDQNPVTTVAARIHKKIQFKQKVGTNYSKWTYVEPKVSVRLTGKVSGPGLSDTNRIKDVKVTLYNWNGRSSRQYKEENVNQATGKFVFGTFALGTNNASSPTRRMKISAKVKDTTSNLWIPRSWWWRGSTSGNGNAYGGTRYLEGSNGVKFTKYNENGFQTNFTFGEIKGHVDGSWGPNASIRISAPPSTMPTGTDLRELDAPYCANDFATTMANKSGNYSQTFLPASETPDKRYMVEVDGSGHGMKLWNGGGGREYGSCLDAKNYSNSTANLLQLNAGGTLTVDGSVRASKGTLSGDLDFSGFTPKTQDRSVTLREFIRGKKVLDSPIIDRVTASSSGAYTFRGIVPGRYYIETGRRTGCSAWYKSIYPDNNLYLQGADRGAERWKTVNGRVEEYAKSRSMGYVRKSPPSGYRGWMYRGFCEQRGAGVVSTTEVMDYHADGAPHARKDYTNKRGATVSGHISRGSKSNKEMMVSIYSTVGTLVMRTAYSGKSGNFKVQGLASGNYNIMVNADSWRGIGRSFSGKHKIRVKAGKNYKVGTLKAKF